jgi:hypothetical protein
LRPPAALVSIVATPQRVKVVSTLRYQLAPVAIMLRAGTRAR